MPTASGILIDRDLRLLLGGALRSAPGAAPISPAQVQPASLDLRLGPVAHRIRAGFLPEHVPIEERLGELATSTVSLEGEGAVLERGLVYLVPLEEELALPEDLCARFNPRSSAGRCDLFTRVLLPGVPRFDEAPHGYRGRPWIEVAPLSFPVRLERGDRLCQVRVTRGEAGLSREEVLERHAHEPLCFLDDRPLEPEELLVDPEGAVHLRIGLAGREPCGWRAASATAVVAFGRRGAHAAEDFWDPVRTRTGRSGARQCVLEPGDFTIFASRERIRVPADLAAEMLPIDVGVGELRNNYAGFFDSGFGSHGDPARPGTPAVLEVRAHDVPFLVEDGQVFFRLRFFRTTGRPEHLYGEGREGPSYGNQDLTLARAFRPGS